VLQPGEIDGTRGRHDCKNRLIVCEADNRLGPFMPGHMRGGGFVERGERGRVRHDRISRVVAIEIFSD
jgi:hypothetical protein